MTVIVVEKNNLKINSKLSIEIDEMKLTPKRYLVSGRNGAGKSVFLRHLAKLTQESESFITNPCKKILYLTNEEITFSNLTIRENLLLNQKIFGITADLDTSLFSQEQLTSLCSQASVGMRHKVGLSLVTVPSFWDLIILDETLSNIDSASREQIIELLYRRQCEGTVVVVVDHHLSDYDCGFNKIMVEDGRIYEKV